MANQLIVCVLFYFFISIACFTHTYWSLDALKGVIKQAEAILFNALQGESCGTVDKQTYITTTHLLYAALDGVESVH